MAVCSIYLVMSASLTAYMINTIHLSAASPSHGDVYLSCRGSEYTSKGTVFVYDATLGGYMNICKERFDRGAAAAAGLPTAWVCGFVDADIAEPGHGDTPPKYFTDAFTLGYA